MPVTIKDVAKLAKVSPSTVSRVIADHPKISDETKQRVYKAMETLKYRPNAIARSLANKTTKTLGLILPNTAKDLFVNPFFINIMRGISLYAQEKGYYIMYTYSNNEDEEVKYIEDLIHSKWIDGVILLTVRENDKCIAYLKEANHPFVVVGRPEDSEGILWVDNDNILAMKAVLRTLLSKGKKNIAFIGGPHAYNVTRDRLEGYKQGLLEGGLEFREELIGESEFTEIRGYEAMKGILQDTVPDAVVTTDDLIAFGALKAVKERNNENIAVVGFNNTPLAAYQSPTLSSVDINAEKLGYHAARLLIDKLTGNGCDTKSYIVETQLVERQSTL